jgi:protein dithiol:quinone oxidoreductase
MIGFFNRSPRLTLLLVGCASALLLAGAWYLQHVLKQRPCPLCILQRYAFIAIALVAFSGALFGRGRASGIAHWLGVLAMSVAGLGVAIKMVFFTTQNSGCGTDAIADFVNGLPTADYIPQYFFANGGCTDVYPPILGLGLPVWALLWFAAFAVIALAAIAARWRRVDALQHWPRFPRGHHYLK